MNDPQTKSILTHLLAGNRLTPIDALNMFGCFRLGARIWELRHELNYDVKDEWHVTQSGKRVKCYYIESKPNNN